MKGRLIVQWKTVESINAMRSYSEIEHKVLDQNTAANFPSIVITLTI